MAYASSTARPTPAGGVARLTRRGRRLLALLVVAVLAVVALLAFSVGRASVEASTQARPAVSFVTVAPGDTLWSIARRVAPSRDPRETLGRLQEINGLQDGRVRAGQRLAVPARS